MLKCINKMLNLQGFLIGKIKNRLISAYFIPSSRGGIRTHDQLVTLTH